jgi:hypothetical protein
VYWRLWELLELGFCRFIDELRVEVCRLGKREEVNCIYSCDQYLEECFGGDFVMHESLNRLNRDM